MRKGLAQRVLIYRLGYLGDTVVALPAFRLIAEAFPNAERRVLTNMAKGAKTAPIASVLDGTGLVHGYLEYPLHLRSMAGLLEVRSRIREFNPDVLVYMAAPRGRLKAYRDTLFFHLCGIRQLVGVPYRKDEERVRPLSNGLHEREGARILRCLKSLGEASLEDPTVYGLCPGGTDCAAAADILRPLGSRLVLVASIGAKTDVQDWGDHNWSKLLARLGRMLPDWGIVMVGSRDEYERSRRLLHSWPGAAVNLCGRTSIATAAAVLSKSEVYVGHDSGPMHLAAAVGTPCIGVFSSRNLPGQWFPYGESHRILYRKIACQGCRLEKCEERKKACIMGISVDEVEAAVRSVIG